MNDFDIWSKEQYMFYCSVSVVNDELFEKWYTINEDALSWNYMNEDYSDIPRKHYINNKWR